MFKRLLLLAMVALAEPAYASPAAVEPAPSVFESPPTDPSVLEGRFANGMRYRILRQPQPAGAVSLRLAFSVGSYDETDAELGFAHFVEHMAFNGTRSIREDRIEETFAARGVSFGRDLNAATGAFSTTYQLDLPKADAASMKLALGWLADVAYGVEFDPGAVDRERGVLLSEMESDYGPHRRVADAISAFYGPEHRLMQRRPIGTRRSLETGSAEALKAFYARWYRPETATIVAVGDLDPQATRRRLDGVFGRWRASGPAGERAPAERVLEGRGLDAGVVTERGARAELSACRLQAAPTSTPERLRRQVLNSLWAEVLKRRFALLVEDGSSGVVEAEADASEFDRAAAAVCVSVAPAGDRWRPALAAVQGELARFAAHGPTETELDAAIKSVRSLMRGAIAGEPTSPAADMADRLATSAAADLPFPFARERLRFFHRITAELTPEALRRAFAAQWTAGEGPLLFVNAPEPPTRDELLAAWREGEKVPVAPFVEPPEPQWAYKSFGADGEVASRTRVDRGDFVRLTFRNGVVVNFKRTDYEPGVVQTVLLFGRGRADVSGRDLFTAEFGAGAFDAGGLGKHGKAELDRLFAETGAKAELQLSPWYFNMNGHVNVNALEDQLALWAAYVSDPGFRPSVDNVAPTELDQWRVWIRSDAGAAALDAARRVLAADDPRLPKNDDRYVRAADMRRVLQPIVTRSPLELTVVGDVDEAALIKVVQSTLGALPSRPPLPAPPADAWFLWVPAERPLPTARATHDGAPDQAAVAFAWPLWVAEDARRREEYAVILLGMVFEAELRRVVRERFGFSYAPTVWTETPDDTDQGVLFIQIVTRPRDVEAVQAAALDIAAKLTAGEITQAQLDSVRGPLLAGRAAQEASNDFWLGALAYSSRDPGGLLEGLGYRQLIGSVTVNDLKAAARTWLPRTPAVAVAVPSAAVLAAEVVQ